MGDVIGLFVAQKEVEKRRKRQLLFNKLLLLLKHLLSKLLLLRRRATRRRRRRRRPPSKRKRAFRTEKNIFEDNINLLGRTREELKLSSFRANSSFILVENFKGINSASY